MDKINKKQRNIFFLVKLILFLGVVVLLFFQLSSVKKSQWISFGVSNWLLIFLGGMLVFANIGIAYKKWKITCEVLPVKISSKTRIYSFFAGITTGFVTPNMLGNFLGRMFYFPANQRAKVVVLTQFSNFGQFVATLLFGTMALFFVHKNPFFSFDKDLFAFISLGTLLVAFLAFFFFHRFLFVFPQKWNLSVLSEILKKKKCYRWEILAWSIVRFLIFTIQFTLILWGFIGEINSEIIGGIWVVYLVTLLLPSLVFGKLGIKESISTLILGSLGVNEVAVFFTSLLIWLINSCLPAIFGLFIYRKPYA